MTCDCHKPKYRFEPESRLEGYEFEPETRLEGFTQDAQAAMTSSPDYFAAWDRWKTALLVIALGALAYQVTRKPRRRR